MGKITGLINPTNLAIGAITGLGVYLGNATKAAAESAQVDAKLAAVLRATGNAAGLTAEDVDGMASSMSRLSGVDDEVIKNGAAVLATFREIGGSVFPQAMQAALDMSAVMGQDLQSSIVQIGKALNDPIAGVTALRKVGVQLTDQQQDQIKSFMAVGDVASAQGVILNELQMEFGGSAEAMNDAGDGSANLGIAMGNLSEAIGSGLLPQIREAKTALADWLDTLAQSIEAGREHSDALTHVAESYGMTTDQLAKARASSADFNEKVKDEVSAYLASKKASEEYQEGLGDLGDTYEDTAKAAEAMSKKNELFLSTLGDIGSALTSYNDGVANVNQNFNDAGFVTDLYRQRIDELRSSYQNGNMTQQEYYDGITNLQKGYADGTFAAQEQQAAIDALSAKYQEAKNQIVLSIVEMKYAQDGWTNAELNAYLTVGKGLGQFTQEQIDAANAALTTADQIINGYSTAAGSMDAVGVASTNVATGLTDASAAAQDVEEPILHIGERAEDAAQNFGDMALASTQLGESINRNLTPAIAGLKSALLSLPPEIFVDIYIRTHGGGGSYLSPLANTTTTSDSLEDWREDTGGGRWMGGPLDMEGGTFVGDGPGGVITPYTEYIKDGWVYNARETRAMLDAGLIRNARHAMFGGDIETPGQLGDTPPSGFNRPGIGLPPRRRDRDIRDVEDEGDVNEMAMAAATEMSTAIAPALQQQAQIAGNVMLAQNSNSGAMLIELRRVTSLLSQIRTEQPDAIAMSQANYVQESRFS